MVMKKKPISIARNLPDYNVLMQDPNFVGVLGAAIGAAAAKVNKQYDRAQRPFVFKEADLNPTVGAGSIYGRNSIFDPCAPGDVFGLQVQTIGFMNWIGWRPNNFYRRRVEFIPWYGPQGTAGDGSITSGAGSPCEDPNGAEYGNCGYDLCHKSWYHRAGEPLDPQTIVQERCETSPRYRINGVQIMDDLEWQLNIAQNVLKQDIIHDLVHGSHINAYEMNGLESLVKTGWTDEDDTPCSQIDSQLISWNHDDLNGDLNGLGNFFDYLDELVTEIEWRSQGIGTIMETDMVLLTSRFMATCLLDAYACYTTCGVTDTGDITDQALRAQQRAARFALNGGPLYDGANAVGFINLKSGRRLPIIVDDAIEFDKPNAMYCTDIYLLTRRIGSMDVMYGEYLDMRVYENRVRAQFPAPTFTARADAAGRFVIKGKEGNWCVQMQIGTSPEIYLSAPWAQARIMDVCCSRKRQPLSGDPHAKDGLYLPGGRPLHKATRKGACGNGDCENATDAQEYYVVSVRG